MNGITGETIVNAASQSVQVLQFVPVSVLVSVRVSLPVTVLPQLDVTRVQRVTSCQRCFLDRR